MGKELVADDAWVVDEVEVDVLQSKLRVHRVSIVCLGGPTDVRTFCKLFLNATCTGTPPEYFVVTKNSSRANPDSRIACPTSGSVEYSEESSREICQGERGLGWGNARWAVSMWLKPVSIAVATYSITLFCFHLEPVP